MIAARLSAVWQVAGVAGAALCCYLVSQSVAAERAAVARVDRQIAATNDDIRRLSTEIGARGRMSQLERWNVQVLALQAPRPRQFVNDGVQLASLYGRAGRMPLPLDPAIAAAHGAIDKVAFAADPPAAAPAAMPMPESAREIAPQPEAQPLLRVATYVRPRASVLAPEAPPIVRAALKAEPPKRLSLLPADIGTLAAIESGNAKAGSKRAER